MIFRRQIGWLVAQAYVLSGARARAVARVRRPGTVLPIVFHAAEPEEVRSILGWLRRAGLLERCDLTFDDGWRQFLRTVPVLEEFDKSATLFIAPGQTLCGRVWTDGTTIAQRQALYGEGEGRRNERLAEWGVPDDRRLMSEAEVREVARHPLVAIGNHTWSHLSCPHRPVDEVMAEVRRAQEVLTEWCGRAPTEFAYPFGRGTAELDTAIRAMGLNVHYTRQGLVTEETRGAARNMVYEGKSLSENIGRLLTAWRKVGETL